MAKAAKARILGLLMGASPAFYVQRLFSMDRRQGDGRRDECLISFAAVLKLHACLIRRKSATRD
jgi:hypothetical protein